MYLLFIIVADKEWKLHKLYLCQVITPIISFTHILIVQLPLNY